MKILIRTSTDTLPGGITCLEGSHNVQPLVTQRQMVLNKEAGAYGSLIYSLLSNTVIQRVEDLRGKRVGVGQPLASGAYQLGWKVCKTISVAQKLSDNIARAYRQFLVDHQIDIFQDSTQVPLRADFGLQ